MAKNSQPPQETSASNRSGGAQAIVELCEVTTAGLAFWSRQRFEIGSELQVRLHRDALLDHADSVEEWVHMCGFVIESSPLRRDDGAQGFRITLLFDTALLQPSKSERQTRPLRFQKTRFIGLARMGLN